MIPSRGAAQAVSHASMRVQLSRQVIPRTRYFSHISNGRPLTSSLSPGAALRATHPSIKAAGLVGSIPVGTRAFSLWPFGKSAPKPEITPAPEVTTTAPAVSAATEPTAATASALAEPVPSSSIPAPDAIASAASDAAASLPATIDTTSLLDLPVDIGYLHALGLNYGWGPTSMMEWIFEHMHVYSGLPWWGSIFATQLLIRLVLFRPFLLAQEHSTRLQVLRKEEPTYVKLEDEMKAAMANGDTPGAMAARQAIKLLEEQKGIKKAYIFVNFLQIPIGIGMFRLLSGMAALPVPGLETGGTLWFTNLLSSDPLYILPIIGPLVLLSTLRMTNKYTPPQQQAMMKIMSVVITPIGVAVTAFLPAAVQWYFCCASILAALQSRLVLLPAFRRWARLPKLPEYSTNSPSSSISSALSSISPPASSSAAPLIPKSSAPTMPTYQAPTPTSSSSNPFSSAISEVKRTLNVAREKQVEYAQRKERAAKVKSQKSEERKMHDEFYDGIRERMAEKERYQKRRP